MSDSSCKRLTRTHNFRFRSACQDFLFIDFGAATETQVEARLWTAHSKVNSKLREHLAEFRKDEGLKKKVERRRAEKNYLTFIKSSQTFYRGFIQRLASAFTDVPEIVSVARGMDLESMLRPPSFFILSDLLKHFLQIRLQVSTRIRRSSS